MSLADTLLVVRDAVAKASEILLEGYRTRPARKTKATEIDFVTEFDQRSEALILEMLAPLGIAVVGEEGGGTPADCTFYVDPLDGTTNYLHGHPFFCISVGLIDAGEPVLGVVHAPALGVTWEAVRGCGTLRNGVACRVTETARLEDSLLATGFPYDRRTTDDDNLREFSRLKKITHGVRRGGSAAIDLAMVADGTYDAYWEMKLNPWDWAAGATLVCEAGGVLSRYDGSAFDVHASRDSARRAELVASNGVVHAALLAQLAQ
jgi:myo-inositol-1(or 4)-monophosphatase